MKFKFIITALLAICTVASFDAAAQSASPQKYTKVSSDTTVNEDTTYVNFNELYNDVVSLTATVDSLSGTIGGTVWLEGRINETWYLASTDTLALQDQALNEIVWPLTSLPYVDYRGKYISTESSQTSLLKLTYNRREGAH